MTWIARFDDPGDGVRVAVKDAIDVRGVPTWSGCVAVRERAVPAPADAACLAGVRAAGAAIVGKTTQTELCLSPTGINEAFGTPVNPLAPDLVPGGSSSGSAVVVATGEVTVGLGTDTGGSVRIPAACCGITGLKTSWRRISTDGVWPLAPSLDSVGPLARDMAGVITGMRVLEPGFTPAPTPARTVGRLHVDGVDPGTERAVDEALAAAGLTVHSVALPGWEACFASFDTIVLAEFWSAHQDLLDFDGVSAASTRALHRGSDISPEQLAQAYAGQRAWQAEVADALRGVDLLALSTLVGPPPRLAEARGFPIIALTAPFNVAGTPALAMPIRPRDRLRPDQPVPVSLQLVGALGGEELLCATGLLIEAALRAT
jgi:amidase